MNILLRIVPLFLFCVSLLRVHAQIDMPNELRAQLEGKNNYEEIKNIVHHYYDVQKLTFRNNEAEIKKINRQLKMWHRWELMNYGHLDEQGAITNSTQRNFDALASWQQRNPDPQTIQPDIAYGAWAQIGPQSYNRLPDGHNGGLGRVNCIGFHPTNASILYIGTPAGGLWYTTNGGITWFPLTDHIPSIGVSGIVVHPTTPSTIYILTGDGDANHRSCLGVMKSTDGGSNWAFTGSFPFTPSSGFRGYKLLMDPTNSNVLFAATDYGIYKTINGGVSWTRQQSGWFTDIEFKPGDNNIMYAAQMISSTPFWRSTNNGGAWSTAGITDVPTNTSRIAIGVSPSNNTYVYFLAGPATASGAYVGVYRSFDSGLDFDLRNSAPNILGYPSDGLDNLHQTTYDLAIEVAPTSVSTVITGGINVWRSTNFGVNFSHVTEWFEPAAAANKYVHADIHNLAYNPLNNWLYVCSDGGVSVSIDNGLTWTQRWNGLQIAQYYMMSGYDANQDRLIGGLQDNGTMYKKSASLTFDHVEGADGYHALIDFTNPDVIYFDANDALYRSTDGGNTLSFTGLNLDCWPALAMHSINNNIIFAGRCDGVYKRTFPGGSWVNTGGRGENRMLTCPSNSQRVYAYGGGVLRRSDNEAGSWAPVGPPTYPPTSQPITDMAVNPSLSSDLYVCVGGYTGGQKIYFSNNSGAGWTNISYNLPNAACGAVVVDNAQNVYLGTDIGVFYRAAGENTWRPFYNKLPKVPINDLYINVNAGTITAATFGRGLWRSPLYSACTSSLALSGSETGNLYYEAASTITSTQQIDGGTGTEVFYKANDYVQMNPGFAAIAGSNFKAFIGPCGTGIPTFRLLNNTYGITDTRMLVKTQLNRLNNTLPTAGNRVELEVKNDIREIKLNAGSNTFVQAYYVRKTDNEIVAWLLREPVRTGVYQVQVTDKLLTGKDLKLVVLLGDERKELDL